MSKPIEQLRRDADEAYSKSLHVLGGAVQKQAKYVEYLFTYRPDEDHSGPEQVLKDLQTAYNTIG